jgi:hypothetical protein
MADWLNKTPLAIPRLAWEGYLMWQPCRQGRVKRSSAHCWTLPFYWYVYYTENDDECQTSFTAPETSEV